MSLHYSETARRPLLPSECRGNRSKRNVTRYGFMGEGPVYRTVRPHSPTPHAACCSLARVPLHSNENSKAGVQSSFGAFDQAQNCPNEPFRCNLTCTELLAWLFSRTVPWRVYLEVGRSSTTCFAGLSSFQNEFFQFVEVGAWVWSATALSFRKKRRLSEYCVKLAHHLEDVGAQ